mmetsp:Transcript_3056/g.4118  ORF Transcript_3056/g.4118 Transcript_3056/m.4118 type:complete len:173 (-) Transcript_3056:175-693(-)|eukprot:CAMPEP_0198140034 /NCGR_PEP_ID=MMETSP1443-20131203/3261_1 /TAXON_ID=186043 /ORGANISM="Entomoneis sp., Strain CCMP2396" /LENGTH=172 /DNA_ID=CAMNT_0043802343 /DNA_START=29 /DNA_END=547 /DNA_ORIENTATION=-
MRFIYPLPFLLAMFVCLHLVSARNLRSIGSSSPKEHWTDTQRAELSYCADSPSSFSIPESTESRDCSWLEVNIQQSGGLCDIYEISPICRETCGVCEDTLRAVELLSACGNKKGEVEILPGKGVWSDCVSLKYDPETKAEACATTAVALFCPVTCDTFHLGTCIAIDPLPDH